MAMTKLTLSADPELVREARRLAAESGTSLSSMFARWVRSALQEQGRVEESGTLTRRALGLIQVPEGSGDRELIEEALADRFGS